MHGMIFIKDFHKQMHSEFQIFGRKSIAFIKSRAGIWYWKRAPEPPEIPLHHDAEMEDAPAGLDDDDEDDVAAVDPTPARPTRIRRPPAPPSLEGGWTAPEGGWTLDHVMSSMYTLTCGLDSLTTEFRGYRQSTSK
ncbi:uncharacterized protein LOC133298202 [Gastrolobium bilobum]|uniref:uncharacterized protein LOC133298202 n=1 Tax=Gastrolobium bilobum TaxID=150636 RepID=UPI002AB299C4|nr:uncharacterized protein LOC133298202 [Gastrolobium bilobum]